MAAQICEKKKNNFLFGNAFLSISMLKITYKSCYNETGVKMMLGKGEHRYANVGKDKILGQKVQKLEYLFCPLARVLRQVVVRVVSLADAAEEHGHHTSKFRSLSQQEGAVAHEHEERGF